MVSTYTSSGVARSGNIAASGLTVAWACVVQPHCHQRGLDSRTTPNRVRTTIWRASLWRRAAPHDRQTAFPARAALACSATIVSCTPDSRALASSRCRPTVSGDSGDVRSQVNTSSATAGLSSSAWMLTDTVILML